MTVATPVRRRVVLYEGEGARPLGPARRYDILRALLDGGVSATIANGAGANATAPADDADLLVLGEFDAPPPGDASDAASAASARIRDVAGRAPAEIVALVETRRAEARAELPAGSPGSPSPAAPGGAADWKPWFPVIDYDRCTHCMQCLSFCLFDVYTVDADKRLKVQNEDKCKTNCPACSRVCPEVAIMFPKYRSGPINGEEVKREDVEREKMKIDVSALLGGDIYSMLRERHVRAASRFSKERDEGKALKERMKCLRELQAALDIPEEVLHALPTVDQIRRKADEVANRGAGGEE